MHIPLAAVSFAIPGVVVAVVIALALLGKIVASRWKTVPPNAIGVFYGRKYSFQREVAGPNGQPTTERGVRGFRTILPIVARVRHAAMAA